MELIFIFIVGTIIGSFIGLLSERWDSERSLIWGRSQCESCSTPLSVWDLFPLLSQLLLKNRCRYCHAKLPYWYFILEFSTGLLFLISWLYLDLAQFLTLLMSLIIIKFDIQSYHFPFVIWLVFAIPFIIIFPQNPLNYTWLLLAILAYLYDIKIGSGDFLWFFIVSFSLSFLQTIVLIQIASILGILFYFIKKQREMPFTPFLSIAYLIVLFLPQSP